MLPIDQHIILSLTLCNRREEGDSRYWESAQYDLTGRKGDLKHQETYA